MTSSTTSSRYKLVLFAALVTAAAGNAFAGSASPYSTEPLSVRVRYDDLDLSTQQGSKALYERISVAARKVCAPPDDIRQLKAMSLSLQCMANAIDKAVSDVHSPQLAAVHASHTGHG